MVSQYQQICTCFRRGVGAAGVDGSLFGKEQVRSVQRQIAVDFVGRNLVITLDAILPASVHHNRCAEDVGLEEDLSGFSIERSCGEQTLHPPLRRVVGRRARQNNAANNKIVQSFLIIFLLFKCLVLPIIQQLPQP